MNTRTFRRWAVIPVAACVVALAALPTLLRPTVTFTDRNDGQTVHAGLGRQFRVSLGSAYWRFDALPGATVVRRVGNPVVSPSPACVPGGGCGTVTAMFLATGPGRIAVQAHRQSCGEAIACTGNAAEFSLTVVVP